MYNGSFNAGNHIWVVKEGVTLISDSTKTVSTTVKPNVTSDSTLWQKIGSAEKCALSVEKEEIENMAPMPYMLQRIDKRTISEKWKLTFDLKTLDKIIFEILFRTTVDANGNFKRGSTPKQRGWVKWQTVDNNLEYPMIMDVFGEFSVDAADFDNKTFVAPQFILDVLDSTLEGGIFNPQ